MRTRQWATAVTALTGVAAWFIGRGLRPPVRPDRRHAARDPTAPGPDTPLDQLAAVSLDTETTGLDVRRDRLLSVAAIPLHGAHLLRAARFDRLVNPGRRIPAASTAVHGITDAMVDGAPAFAAIASELRSVCAS